MFSKKLYINAAATTTKVVEVGRPAEEYCGIMLVDSSTREVYYLDIPQRVAKTLIENARYLTLTLSPEVLP